MRPRGFTERHRPRASLRIDKPEGVVSDVAPAQVEHLAPAAAGERQQPDRADLVGPLGLAGVERAAEPRQFVGVEEPGDAVAYLFAAFENGDPRVIAARRWGTWPVTRE